MMSAVKGIQRGAIYCVHVRLRKDGTDLIVVFLLQIIERLMIH